MSREIVRRVSPEKEELARKREELATTLAILADRELELADLAAQLKSFEGRYLRHVGVLYAELDDWEAKLLELQASLHPSEPAKQSAHEARRRAQETREATQGEASKAEDFQPTADLKTLFRDVAKLIHPDFAQDDDDRKHRTRLMIEANEAYRKGDSAALQRILEAFENSPESVHGQDTGAELIRVIRQIYQAKKAIAAVEDEFAALHSSEIAQMKRDAETAQLKGRDLLEELEISIRAQVDAKRSNYETLAKGRRDRDGET